VTETPSQELATSISLAEKKGIVFVAYAGNNGQMEMVYPAGLTSVMGVASTNPQDQRSSFSNYGDQIVGVAAPGEAIVTTYPLGGYAVDLLQSGQRRLTVTQARVAMAQAQLLLAFGMGNGRIDLYRAASTICH
jgi:Subtilase family